MNHRGSVNTLGLLFLSALVAINSSVRAQDPAPTPSPSREVAATQPATPSAASPAPTRESDFWTREQMTGDWGGERSRWKEEGVELNFKETNFYQGVARLRVEHQFEAFYNFHITPWLRLTGDLQIIRPTRGIVSTTIIPGGRLVMIF